MAQAAAPLGSDWGSPNWGNLCSMNIQGKLRFVQRVGVTLRVMDVCCDVDRRVKVGSCCCGCSGTIQLAKP